MSGLNYFEYRESQELARNDPSFYALIAAAMRKADSFNAIALRRVWPDVWDDLQARYDAPGGLLPGDPESLVDRVSQGKS